MNTESYLITVADLGYYENEKQIEVLVKDYDDHYELKTVVDGVEFEAQADDMFSAFQLLRDKMLKMAWGIMCNAARINAVQSGMMRDLDVVYLVEMGKPAGMDDVHGFWDYCEMERYVYTAEQEAFRKKWMDSLKKQWSASGLQEMSVIGFHNPDEAYGFLSNWYLSAFTVDGIRFSSMEQYMMYKKAMLFGDSAIAAQIKNTDDVVTIKELGRKVSGYNDSVWNGMRQIIIYKGLLEKFRQNDDLRKALLDTGNNILAECAVKDCIWGIGLSMTDDNRNDLNAWKGQNLLGYTLMLVRDELRNSVEQ